MRTDFAKQRVNYDEIAHLYDEPLRDHALDENLLTLLREQPSLKSAHIRILDMGCGTGKQLTADKRQFPDLPMFGQDLFNGMLQQAQKRSRSIYWIQADNMATPFAANSFHYITNQFSYAHVQDKAQFFAEVFRILVRDGRFVLTNIDPWQMPNWLIYRYFPAAQSLDFQDFLPADKLSQLFQEVGLGNIQLRRRQLTPRQTLVDFYRYASERHRTSQFMAISDADYAQGLQTLEAELLTADSEKVLSSQMCLLTIRGDKLKTVR